MTVVLLVPDTVAANCCCHFSGSVVEVGETVTEIVGVETATEADADLDGSATLTVWTVYVPANNGAVYRPALLIVPPDADQVTPVLLVPDT